MVRLQADSHICKRVVIVGGGITGLSAAHSLYELSQERVPSQPLDIVVLEQQDRPGGVIRTTHRNGCIIECGPDSFITQKPWAINLCQDLDLTSHIISTAEKQRRTFVACKRRLHPVPEGFYMLAPTNLWTFFSSSLFSPFGKVRMLMDMILPGKPNIDDQSLSEFVTRRLGREALERIAQPMIGGVYIADPSKLSLRATMPAFLELEEKYGSIIKGMLIEKRQAASMKSPGHPNGDGGARYSLFASLDQGMQVLIDRLNERLPKASVRCHQKVVSVAPGCNGKRWQVNLAGSNPLAADAVILATPAPAAARILKASFPEIGHCLEGIEFASSAVVNLIYKRQDIPHKLDGFGFVVPHREGLSLLACTFSSVKFPNRAPHGTVLLRAFVGGAMNPNILQGNDQTILSMVQRDLRTLLAVTADPEEALIARWPGSMPQYHVGHLQVVEQLETTIRSLPGLALAGNSYRGVGIPDCILSGQRAAETIFGMIT